MIYRLPALLLLSMIATPVAYAQMVSDPVTVPKEPTSSRGTVDTLPGTAPTSKEILPKGKDNVPIYTQNKIMPTISTERVNGVETAPDIYKVDPAVDKAVRALRNMPPQSTTSAATPLLVNPDIVALIKSTTPPVIGGPFNLINQYDRRVTDADFRSSYMLVMFGYTHCSYDCQPVVANAVKALSSLPQAQASRIMPIFVTLDPARDNPNVLKAYLANYNKRIIGLTGNPDEIARMAKNFGVNYRVAENPDVAIERALSPQDLAVYKRDPDYRSQTGEPYTIDYSPFVYLMGPDGKLVTLFNGGLPPDYMARTLANALK